MKHFNTKASHFSLSEKMEFPHKTKNVFRYVAFNHSGASVVDLRPIRFSQTGGEAWGSLPPRQTAEHWTRDGTFTGSVLIAQDGVVFLSNGYGLADREQGIPNTPQMRFHLGSLSKQFTAMAILILQSQGKLNVQDPICHYIANCPAAWQDGEAA